ncbi:hypothetical protein [Brevundimonas sp.]|jgi:hypothetical protein|uniref:hypothetical protein n=1 Tax=Brevundimonas sp. TaxID=1871086 RepID=UPI003784E134
MAFKIGAAVTLRPEWRDYIVVQGANSVDRVHIKPATWPWPIAPIETVPARYLVAKGE